MASIHSYAAPSRALLSELYLGKYLRAKLLERLAIYGVRLYIVLLPSDMGVFNLAPQKPKVVRCVLPSSAIVKIGDS